MTTAAATYRNSDQHENALDEKLSEINHFIMGKLADNDAGLLDRSVDAIAEASILGAKLYTLAHSLTLGLSPESPEFEERVCEAIVGISMLADKASPSESEGACGWE